MPADWKGGSGRRGVETEKEVEVIACTCHFLPWNLVTEVLFERSFLNPSLFRKSKK